MLELQRHIDVTDELQRRIDVWVTETYWCVSYIDVLMCEFQRRIGVMCEFQRRIAVMCEFQRRIDVMCEFQRRIDSRATETYWCVRYRDVLMCELQRRIDVWGT